MKYILLGLTCMFAASTAQADQGIYDLMDRVNDRVAATDLQDLSSSERAEIRSSLQNVIGILDGQGSSTRLLCVVSSNHSSYYRIWNGSAEVGADMSRDECRELINSTANRLVCSRSLNHGSYFRIYRSRDALEIGDDMSKDTCLNLVSQSNRDYTCSVSTNHSSYYSIYEIRTRTRIGGDLSLDRCLADLNGR